MDTHRSVLLKESIDALAIKEDGIYFDGTFGRGGHSKAVLERLGPNGRLYGIDKDLDAIAYAKEHIKDTRFHLFHGSFADIATFAEEAAVSGKVSGILLDLGVSSPQLDNAERGFSFMQDGPLDMRMNKTEHLSAKTFINEASVEEMIDVFRTYGEERYSKRIATAIETARKEALIDRTLVLAEIVKVAHPKWEKHKHPATRVFQAIRIHVNRELEDLKACLSESVTILEPKGRLAVISFHSLEDRIVKNFMRDREEGPKLPKGLPIRAEEIQTDFKRIGKAIMPLETEVEENTRARSAVLRIGEKQ